MQALIRIPLGCFHPQSVWPALGVLDPGKKVCQGRKAPSQSLFSTIITSLLPPAQLQSKCEHRHISEGCSASSSSAAPGIPAPYWHLLPTPHGALCVLRHVGAILL